LQEEQGFTFYVLSNLVVLFLPANTTSHVQPLDQGIIAAFKAHYKRYLIDWTLKQYDNPNSQWKDDLSKVKPTFYQMLVWSKRSWDEITPVTIANCWAKSGLLPELPAPPPRAARRYQLQPLDHNDIVVVDEPAGNGPANRPVAPAEADTPAEPDALVLLGASLRSLAERVDDELLTPEEYIDLPGEHVREELTDAQLVALVMTDGQPNLADSDEEDEPLPQGPALTPSQVHSMFEQAQASMLHYSFVDEGDLKLLETLMTKLARGAAAARTQSTLQFVPVPRL
jgi:hypothetical protein